MSSVLKELADTYNICVAKYDPYVCAAGVEDVLGLLGEQWTWQSPFFHRREIPKFCWRIWYVGR